MVIIDGSQHIFNRLVPHIPKLKKDWKHYIEWLQSSLIRSVYSKMK